MGENALRPATVLALSMAVAIAAGPGGALAAGVLAAGSPGNPTRTAGSLAQAAIAGQTAAIAKDVARMRGLELRRQVPVRVLSLGEFERMLREKIDAELPPTRARGLGLAFEALGWVEPPFNLRETLLNLILTQAAAVYDPETDAYLFIEGVADSQLVDMISSHELVHALTDQHFDLDRLMMRPAREGRLTEDQGQAMRFLVEGDATYVMMMRTVMGMLAHVPGRSPSGAGLDEAGLAASLRTSLETLAAMPYSMQVQTMLAGASALGGRIGASVAALDSLPVVLVRPLLEAYLRGALLVADLRARGGWAAVDSLYRNPPASTEQVLHFNKLYPERDAPRIPALKTSEIQPSGTKILCEETLGELYVRTLFETGDMAGEAAELAAGWDGDRLVVSEGDKSWSVVWVTLWDGEEEASAFEDGLRRFLGRRAGNQPQGENRWDVRGRPTLVGRRGDRVATVQSGDFESARETLDLALRGDATDARQASPPGR
jgi:hypothetical protein